MRNIKLASHAGLLLLIAAVAASCGGGGGSGGDDDFGFSGTGFGFSNIFGNTTGAGTSNQFPILDGVNLPIIIYFNAPIDPQSVNDKSVSVTTITVPDAQDPDNLVQQPGGIVADVNYIVVGSNLYIKPTLFFTKPEGKPIYGFLSHAAYEIKFSQEPSQHIVTSTSGKKLVVPQSGKPLAFITTDTIYDEWPGPPEPTFYAFNDKGAEVLLEKEPLWNIPSEVIANGDTAEFAVPADTRQVFLTAEGSFNSGDAKFAIGSAVTLGFEEGE